MKKRLWAAIAAACIHSSGWGWQSAEGIITVGPLTSVGPPTPNNVDGVDCTYCTDNESGFARAIYDLLLAHGGGEIVVAPGIYEFTSPVVFGSGLKGIRISGSRGAVIRPHENNDVGLFDLQGDGWTLSGMTFEIPERQSTPSYLLRSTGADITIEDCYFRVEHSTGGGESTALVWLAKTQSEERTEGGLIEGNIFSFGAAGDEMTDYVGIKVHDRQLVRIRANSFIGRQDSNGIDLRGDLARAIELANAEFASVRGNIFRRLYSAEHADGVDQFAVHVRIVPSAPSEGHHTTIVGNVFDEVLSSRIARLEGTGFHVITGNVFREGRTAVQLVVQRSETPPTINTESHHSTVSGNHFSKMGPQVFPGGLTGVSRTLVLQEAMAVNVTSNQFDDFEKGQIILRGSPEFTEEGMTTRIQIVGNQFRRAGGFTATSIHPIFFKDGEVDFVQVFGNTRLGNFVNSLFNPGVVPNIDAGENWDS